MATASFYQRGETIDRVNSGDEVIEANTIQVIGKRLGVVAGRAVPGAKYAVNVEGIYKIPKKADEAIAAGTEVYFDSTAGTATATSGEKAILAGFATEDAAAADSTVTVKINA